jgi:hypothetical protein
MEFEIQMVVWTVSSFKRAKPMDDVKNVAHVDIPHTTRHTTHHGFYVLTSNTTLIL